MMRDSWDTKALTHTLSQTPYTQKCEYSIQLVTVLVPVAILQRHALFGLTALTQREYTEQ